MSVASRLDRLEDKLRPKPRYITITYDKDTDGPEDEAIEHAAAAQGISEIAEDDVVCIINLGWSL